MAKTHHAGTGDPSILLYTRRCHCVTGRWRHLGRSSSGCSESPKTHLDKAEHNETLQERRRKGGAKEWKEGRWRGVAGVSQFCLHRTVSRPVREWKVSQASLLLTANVTCPARRTQALPGHRVTSAMVVAVAFLHTPRSKSADLFVGEKNAEENNHGVTFRHKS